MMHWLLVFLICAMPLSGQSAGSGGVLAVIGDGSVSVRNDGRTQRFVVNKKTEIWRGRDVGLGQLRVGDTLRIEYRVSGSGEAVATRIWSNIDRWDGKVTHVAGDSVEIARIGEHGERLGMATLVLDGRTVFNEGSAQDLRVGRRLEVVGLVLDKHRMRATRVLHVLK